MGRMPDHDDERPPAGQALDAWSPLSRGQTRLWFLDQVSPGRALFNIALRYRLTGPLDVGVLERAVTALVERHEVLRTSYHLDPARKLPRQRVDPIDPIVIRTRPPSTGTADASWREQWLGAQVSEPFDLAKAPMLRVAIASESATRHHVVLTLHHIAADGWSMGIVDDELWSLYEAMLAGEEPSLSPLISQYADYARWQSEALADPSALAREREYWLEQLSGAPYVELRPDRPSSSAVSGPDADEVTCSIPDDLLEGLEELARAERASLFVVLQSALSVLLHLRTAEDDVVSGTASAGRSRSVDEPLVGFFVNLMVLRVPVRGEMTLRDVLRGTRDTVLDALDHQQMPFDVLVDELHPTRAAGQNPLFQVVFQLLHDQDLARRIDDLLVEQSAPPGSGNTWFDLALTATRGEEQCSLSLAFSTDRFGAPRMRRFLEAYVDLLWQMVGDLAQQVRDVTSPESRSFAVALGSLPADRGGRDLGVVDAVRGHAATTPGAAAVRFDGDVVSYADLVARADQLVDRLRAEGLVRGDRVGLHLPNSDGLIVAMVAAVLGGMPYVPLPPGHPPARLADTVRLAGVRAVVSDERDAARLGVGVIPTDLAPLGSHRVVDPVGVLPHELAYTLFTSGSSGAPKGVDVTHGNLDCMSRSVAELFGIGPGVRVLQFASAAFDVSVLEVFVTLFGGGVVCVAPDDARRSPELFAQFLRDERIQAGVFPPALLSQVEPEVFDDLTLMAVGGEAFGADLVNAWNRDGLTFFNAYGPTETTVMSTAFECPTREWDAAPPIGRALDHEYAVVLDAHGRPCPVGTPGELALGGACVAQGYLGDPRLTAAKFVASPFGATGDRMYRTGDICVVREDGNIVYLGRPDDQIKIRGYRISVLEIERALASLDGVEQSAVIVTDAASTSDRRLVAFVTTAGDELDHVLMRRQLATTLPGYMVPSRIVQLPSLPVTTSEKVDRRALARLAASASLRAEPAPAAADGGADRLSSIFAALLCLGEVPRDVSFFDLGGNSLQLTTLCRSIREEYGVAIDTHDLLVHQSIDVIGELIDARLDASGPERPGAALDDPWRVLHEGPDATPLVLVHDAGGNLFAYRDVQRAVAAGRPVYGLDGSHLDSGPITIEALAAQHLATIRRHLGERPFIIGGWSLGGLVAYQIYRLATGVGARCERLVMFDTEYPQPASATGWTTDRVFFEHLKGSDVLPQSARWREPGPTVSPEAHLVEVLRSVGADDGRWPAAAVTERLARFRSLTDAALRYTPESVAGDILLVHATENRSLADQWVEKIAGKITIELLPGDHFSVIRGEGARRIGTLLERTIDRIAEPDARRVGK